MNSDFQYDTFEDWFEEQQSFSLRSEYLWSELGEDSKKFEGVVQWLKAGWECARETKEKHDGM